MSWLMDATEAATSRAEEAARAARQQAFDAEVAEASRGDIPALEATLERLDAEAADVRIEYSKLQTLAATRPREFSDEFETVRRRADQLPRLRSAVEQRRLVLIAERGEQLAADWNRAPAPKLLNAHLKTRATQLADIAELVSSWEGERAKGASAQAMYPLPAGDVAALVAFTAYVAQLKARGLKIDFTGWPPVVKERVS